VADEPAGYWHTLRRTNLSRRRVLAAGLAAASAATLAACGRSGSPSGAQSTAPANRPSAQPQSGGTLYLRQSDNPPTLDPHRTTSGPTEGVLGVALSRLLQYKVGVDPRVAEDHQVTGDLASSVETPDATTWTVKLRPDAKFHNIAPVSGHAVEAEDVKATFTRALDPKNPGRSALDSIEPNDIQTPDKSTVVFKLKYAYAPFQYALASSTYGWILPREAQAGTYDPAKQVIGSGPFIADTFTPDVSFNFKKNPDWYDRGRPYADGLQWAVIPNISQARAQFTSGHLDVYGSAGQPIPIDDIDTLKRDNPKAQLFRTDPSTAQILYFHLGDPSSPFQDIRLRRAFSMAIDRDALAKAVYNNDAEPQYYVYLNLGKWAMHQSDLPADTAQYYKFNPAESKKLLQASGFADKQFKFIYVADYISLAYEKMSEAIANMLSTAGIKVTLQQVDYTKDFIGGGKGIRYGNYPTDAVVSSGISVYEDVDTFIYNYYHSKATSGLSHLNDGDLDARITKARTVVIEADRVKAYLDIQKYLADKMYTVAGLPQGNVYVVTQPRVQNFQESLAFGAGTESFSKLWLKS
jgi:peptide/nickel transport system substrate-binding protein